MSEPRELDVAPSQAGARLDLFLGEALGLSRAKLKRLFDDGAVRVGGRPAKKGLTLQGGEHVRVELPDEAPALIAEPERAPLEILYEDADVVVVDKPSGTPSQPLRPGEMGTAANALAARYPEMAGVADDPREAGLCHRLDVETSGALLAARTRPAWEALRKAFGEQQIDKRYWALVTGPLADEGEIDLPLRHHPRHTDRVEPALDEGPAGRPAQSRFRILARAGDFSLVEVQILTGVLHQVRAHLSAIGAPLVGDGLYGGRALAGLDRFFLHARSLGFPHPADGRRISVVSPLPPELTRVLESQGLAVPPGAVKRAILHVDMDAFYASVEQRDAPALRGKQVIVGGHAQRGVVLAASYEVRGLGVRSAMPMHRAVRLAPQAIVVPPRFTAYLEASERIHAVFERFTPLIEPLSLDEAFLDVTASQALFGTPVEIAERIRREIREETQLPCSAGVAPVKFAAKVASDLAKPNGLRVVPEDGVVAFLAPLPVGRLWGVGPKLEERLHSLGLFTIGDLAGRGEDWLTRQLGEAGASLHALSRGVDPRAVVPDREAKSIGAEDTFEVDLAGVEDLRAHVHSQALRVGRRLRHAGLKARVVVLKLKLADFTLLTRRRTLDAPTDDGQTIYRTAATLLDEHHLGRAFRLTGVSASDFGERAPQLDLFAPPAPKHEQLNAALDRIAAKFGVRAITTADLAPEEEAEAKGRRLRQTGWQGGRGEE